MTRLTEREKELATLLCEECRSPAEVTAKLKMLFAGTLETDARSRNGRASGL